MPTYQYRCTECGRELEVVQKFSDPSLTQCPNCSGELRKIFNAVGVVFKGSGFYRTDSREADKLKRSAAHSGAKSDAKHDGSASDGAKSDDATKTASTGEGSKTSGTSNGSTGGKESAATNGSSAKKAAGATTSKAAASA